MPAPLATQVLRERILALSWGSALLLHVAEPRIAQGVCDHSVFLNNPSRRVARLYSTANTMLDLLVGSLHDTKTAAARINAIHDGVYGFTRESHHGLPAGTSYTAHDPQLLAWVHVALHVTLLRAYTALVGPLTRVEQDQYCREVALVEPLLGIPDARLPRDVQSLQCEFEARLSELSVGANACRLGRGILSPALPLWASPVTRMARLCTVGFLPASVRAAYGLPWSRHHARLFRGSLLAARCFLPCVPDRVRFVPPELLPWLTRQGVLTA